MGDLWPTLVKQGGALAALVIVFFMLKAIIPLIKRNGETKSAGLTANEWKTEIRNALRQTLTETMPERHEKLETLMGKVIENEFRKRNDAIREIVRDELSHWRPPR